MKPEKYILILLFSLIFGLCATPLAEAQEGFTKVHEPTKVLQELNESGKSISSIKSSFIQEKHLQFLDETIISRGSFWFRKENSLRWAYLEPFEYAIIIHGSSFQILDGEHLSSYDIESNAAFREINNMIVGMVQGKVSQEERFTLEILENNQHFLVKMEPRDPGMRGVFSKMEVYFLKRDLQVDQVIIREGEEDFTLIRFLERTINESIADSVFTATY